MTHDLNWSSSQTMGQFFSQVGQTTGYWELVLFVEFIIIVLVGSNYNKKTTGISNVTTWIIVSAFATTISAAGLFMGQFINIATLILCIVITLISFFAVTIGNLVSSEKDAV